MKQMLSFKSLSRCHIFYWLVQNNANSENDILPEKDLEGGAFISLVFWQSTGQTK